MKALCYLTTIITMVYKVAGSNGNENHGNIMLCKLLSKSESNEFVYDRFEDYKLDSAFDDDISETAHTIDGKEYPINDDIVLRKRKRKHKRGHSTSLSLSTSSSSSSSETDYDGYWFPSKKRYKKRRYTRTPKTHLVVWYTTPTSDWISHNPLTNDPYSEWLSHNPLTNDPNSEWLSHNPLTNDPNSEWISHNPLPSSISYKKPYPTKSRWPTRRGHVYQSTHREPYATTTRGYGAKRPGSLRLLFKK